MKGMANAMEHDSPQHAPHDSGDDDDDSDNIMEAINLAQPEITHLGGASREFLMEQDQMLVQHGSFGPYCIPPSIFFPP